MADPRPTVTAALREYRAIAARGMRPFEGARADLLRAVPDDANPLVECQDCDWVGREWECGWIDDMAERVLTGETMPPGCCPACQSVADYAPGHEPTSSAQYREAGYRRAVAMIQRVLDDPRLADVPMRAANLALALDPRGHYLRKPEPMPTRRRRR